MSERLASDPRPPEPASEPERTGMKHWETAMWEHHNGKTSPRQKRRNRRVIGIIAGVLIAVAIAVAVGVTVSQKKKDSSKSKGNANDDPSIYYHDPRFHKSFYGIAYTPDGSIPPACGNSLEAVIKDVQILSQLTPRLRLYGAECNQSALVLEAIKQTKVDMQIFLGNYVIPDEQQTYDTQRDALKSAIQAYGTEHISGITVGNEYMLNYLTKHGDKDPNGAIANQGATQLIADIKDTRDMLNGLSLQKTIPVGNADAGSYFNNEVLEAVDYGMSNVHAWFANTTIQDAATWVTTYFKQTNVEPAAALPNQPKMYIAETGWPTASSDESNETNGASEASVSNLQTFLDNFVCQANQNNIPYFFFEFTDEKWKDIQYGGVEGHWGLFYGNRTLKEINLPSCVAPQ